MPRRVEAQNIRISADTPAGVNSMLNNLLGTGDCVVKVKRDIYLNGKKQSPRPQRKRGS